jgi:hypothetical protein
VVVISRTGAMAIGRFSGAFAILILFIPLLIIK